MSEPTMHTVSLAEDRRTIRLTLVRGGGDGLCDELGPADMDMLIEALTEMWEQMVED